MLEALLIAGVLGAILARWTVGILLPFIFLLMVAAVFVEQHLLAVVAILGIQLGYIVGASVRRAWKERQPHE